MKIETRQSVWPGQYNTFMRDDTGKLVCLISYQYELAGSVSQGVHHSLLNEDERVETWRKTIRRSRFFRTRMKPQRGQLRPVLE